VECGVWSVELGVWSLKLGVWRRKSEVRSQKSEVESLDKKSKIEKYKTTIGTLAHFRHSKLVTGVWSLKLGVWRRKSEVRSQKSEVESLDKKSKIEKYKITLGTLAHFRHSKLVTGVWSVEFGV